VLGGLCGSGGRRTDGRLVPPIVTTARHGLLAGVAGRPPSGVGIAGYLRYGAAALMRPSRTLLLTYIGRCDHELFVEGHVAPTPAIPTSPRPSRLAMAIWSARSPGTDVHGLAVGVPARHRAYVLIDAHDPSVFAARVTGRAISAAALAQGLPVGKLIVACAMIAGGAARGNLSWLLCEWPAIQGRANASLAAGYALPAFSCRPRPPQPAGESVPIAILFGGLVAARALDPHAPSELADATRPGVAGADLRRVLLASETPLRPLCLFQTDQGKRPDMNAAVATVLIAMLGGAIRVSTPVHSFVALGECLTEKSGRVNLGWKATLCSARWSAMPPPITPARPGIGVPAAGFAGSLLGAMHGYICKLPKVNDVAVGIRHDAVWHWQSRFFFGKPYIQPTAPRLPSLPFGGWSSDLNSKRARHQSAVLRRHRDCVSDAWALRNTALGAGGSGPSATARRRRVRWAFRSISCASSPRRSAGSWPASAALFSRCRTQGSWNQGLSSGQGLMAVALVIFRALESAALASSPRCCSAALARSARRCSRSASRRAIISSTPPLYILTLIIMIATSSAKRSARDMPGELSMVR